MRSVQGQCAGPGAAPPSDLGALVEAVAPRTRSRRPGRCRACRRWAGRCSRCRDRPGRRRVGHAVVLVGVVRAEERGAVRAVGVGDAGRRCSSRSGCRGWCPRGTPAAARRRSPRPGRWPAAAGPARRCWSPGRRSCPGGTRRSRRRPSCPRTGRSSGRSSCRSGSRCSRRTAAGMQVPRSSSQVWPSGHWSSSVHSLDGDAVAGATRRRSCPPGTGCPRCTSSPPPSSGTQEERSSQTKPSGQSVSLVQKPAFLTGVGRPDRSSSRPRSRSWSRSPSRSPPPPPSG